MLRDQLEKTTRELTHRQTRFFIHRPKYEDMEQPIGYLPLSRDRMINHRYPPRHLWLATATVQAAAIVVPANDFVRKE